MFQTTLPKIENRKQYMEELARMMSPRRIEEEDVIHRGRRTELKTYIVESNAMLPDKFSLDKHLSGQLVSTGLDDIKILHLTTDSDVSNSFYLDQTDKRFWLLHTHSLAEEAKELVDDLTSATSFKVDSAWFSSGMLREISKITGNSFDGAGINYEPVFEEEKEEFRPGQEELKVSISGFPSTEELLKTILNAPMVRNRSAFKKVRISRGSVGRFVTDDFSFSGRFSVKSGRSIDDHMDLVDSAKTLYKKEMDFVESFSIGAMKSGDLAYVEGKPFEFHLDRPIQNWEAFFNTFLGSKYPFRLWGIKKVIRDEYFQILAVDLHTGHSVDMEITKDLFRVYLPKGSCGNVVLRLFVNLQQFVDSRITCNEIAFDGVNV